MPDTEGSHGSNGVASSGNGGGSNNSSDFVRKLYKMLEEPQYANVVRWGNDGTSFVVLENEKFTKHILPKHFKHSNFASFVRQLNKYDFHKVRQNDENGQSPYGPGAWEFVHPEFRADRKDNLDNIRRKAPAPRRQQTTEDHFPVAAQQMMDGMAGEVRQLRHEMQRNQSENKKYTRMLVDQVARLKKVVTRQSQALDELISWHIETLRGDGHGIVSQEQLPRRLLHTRVLVEDIFKDLGNDVEKLNPLYEKYPNTSEDDSTSVLGESGDMYGLGTYGVGAYDRRGGMVTGSDQVAAGDRKKDIWGDRKPCILLVEDEAIAAKIAQKRLQTFGCTYEYARTGPDAVKLVNAAPHKFDLILMDIKLPGCGGIEATAMIRVENYPRMPIIAMTASRQPDDLTTYLKHGMDDLLPKPFSNEVFEALLRKHLPHLLHRPGPQENMSGRARISAYPDRHPAPLPPASMVVNTNLSKFDQTPNQSPSGSLSWHSPATASQMQGTSPVTTNGILNPNGGALMQPNGISANGMSPIANGMTSGLPPGMANGSHPHMSNGVAGMNPAAMDPSTPMGGSGSYLTAMANSHLHVPPISRAFTVNAGYTGMVDGGLDFGDERPEKRQRIYAPTDIGYPP